MSEEQQKDQALRALQSQSLLGKVQEMKEAWKQKRREADEQVLDLEAQLAAKHLYLEQMRAAMVQAEGEMQQLQLQLVERQEAHSSVQGQMAMLSDWEGLLQGTLFQGSAEGALFFTCSAKDFAHRMGMGEMGLEALVRASQDGMSFVHQGKTYFFIKGLDQRYYFHGEEFSL